MLPLHDKIGKKIYECFSAAEIHLSSEKDPLELYLCEGGTHTQLNKILLDEEMINYMNVVINPQKHNVLSAFALSRLNHKFSLLLEIVPLPESSAPTVDLTVPWSQLYGKDVASSFNSLINPLIFVCSPMLWVFPWEIFVVPCTILRFFLLNDITSALKREGKHQIKGNLGMQQPTNQKPSFTLIACYFSQREFKKQEAERKRNIVQRLCKGLSANTNIVHGSSEVMSPLYPFHSTLARKGKIEKFHKYKFVTLIDLVQRFPQSIARFVENTVNPVILLTYADLMERSETVYYLLSSQPLPIIIFIPEKSTKLVGTRLMKILSNVQKSEEMPPTVYLQIMLALKSIQKEICCPIALFNLWCNC